MLNGATSAMIENVSGGGEAEGGGSGALILNRAASAMIENARAFTAAVVMEAGRWRWWGPACVRHEGAQGKAFPGVPLPSAPS